MTAIGGTATLRAAGTAPTLANTNANGGGVGITLNSGDTLAGFTLGGTQSTAIIGTSVAGLTINSLTLSSGASSSSDGISISNLTGTAAVSNSTLSGAFNDVVRVTNTSGTLTNLTFDSDTIANTSNPASTAGLDLDGIELLTPSGSPSVGLTITNSSLTSARQFLLFTDFNGSTTGNVVLKNDHFSNSLGGSTGGSGVDLSGGNPTSNTAVTYDIENNTFRDSHTSALSIGYTNGKGTWTGRVLNNQVGVSGVGASGSGPGADGVRIVDAGNDGAGAANETLVQGNTILNYGEVGLFLSATNGNNILDATVFGNTMAQPGSAAAGAFAGIWVNSGALAADTNTVNVVIGDAITAANKNTLTGSDPSLATDVFLENDSSTLATLNLSKNGSTSTKAHGVIVDDNIVPSGEAEGDSGTITLVSTLPTTPPLVPDVIRGAASPAGTATSPEKPDAGLSVPTTIGTISAGTTIHLTFQATVNSPYSGGSTVSNIGTVSGSNFTAASSNAVVTNVNVVANSADLQIMVAGSPGTVIAGDNVTYSST